jgi:hypothetical protein
MYLFRTYFVAITVVEQYPRELNNYIMIYIFFPFRWISLMFVHCSYEGVLIFFENGLWISSVLWMKHTQQTFCAIKLNIFHCCPVQSNILDLPDFPFVLYQNTIL